MFLSIGIVMAVFGMRPVTPMAVLVAATRQSPLMVLNLSVHDPKGYAHADRQDPTPIASFGDACPLVIFMDFRQASGRAAAPGT